MSGLMKMWGLSNFLFDNMSRTSEALNKVACTGRGLVLSFRYSLVTTLDKAFTAVVMLHGIIPHFDAESSTMSFL